MSKEQFIQPAAPPELPPTETEKFFNEKGIDIREKYFDIIRDLNKDGVLEILPDSGSFGMINGDTEEEEELWSLDEFMELAKEFYSTKRNRIRRRLQNQLNIIYRPSLEGYIQLMTFEKYVVLSDAWENIMDKLSKAHPDEYSTLFDNLSGTIQVSAFNTLQPIQRDKSLVKTLIDHIDPDRHDTIARMIDPYALFEYLSLFKNISQDTVEVAWRNTNVIVDFEQHKGSFRDDVDLEYLKQQYG